LQWHPVGHPRVEEPAGARGAHSGGVLLPFQGEAGPAFQVGLGDDVAGGSRLGGDLEHLLGGEVPVRTQGERRRSRPVGEPRPQVRLHQRPVQVRADDGGIPADDLPPDVPLGVPGERAAAGLGERGERARCATALSGQSAATFTLSIHVRTGRATVVLTALADLGEFQFTRARGARLAIHPPPLLEHRVST